MHSPFAKVLLIAIILGGCLISSADQVTWIGKVISVIDGDTIEVQRDGIPVPVKIRLFGVDAPEEDQPYASHATEFVSGLCFDQQVTVNALETDKYGRTVATIILANRQNLSEQIVRHGYGWWYKEYAPRVVALQRAQLDAIKADKGLWADAGAISPWDWRAGKRSSTPSQPMPNSGSVIAAPLPLVQQLAPQGDFRQIEVAPQPAPRAQASQSLYSQPQRVIAQPQSSRGDSVYVTNTGKKYHSGNCKYLSQSKIPISRDDALARGYGGCSVCKP